MKKWQHRVHEIIFEADTPMGKLFDVALLWMIIASVLVVMLESVEAIRLSYGWWLDFFEWTFTILFTIEYILRIVSIRRPIQYIWSFFGLVDLVSIIPTYLSLVFAGSHYLLVIRILRLLRVFRILKLVRHVKEARLLLAALRSSRAKLTVFLGAVLSLTVIIGTLMYLIEGPENGFASIPLSIYWAIVTLTTVGYGDISPHTVTGQTLASIVMILGYAIIAVPTGIVSASLVSSKSGPVTTRSCHVCSREGHDHDAEFCKFCGSKL